MNPLRHWATLVNSQPVFSHSASHFVNGPLFAIGALKSFVSQKSGVAGR